MTTQFNNAAGAASSSGKAPLDRRARELLEEVSRDQPDLQKLQDLIDIGADIECRNEGDETPLHVAVRKGTAAAAELLIDSGADKYALKSEGAPLFYAIAYDHLPVVRLLLKKGVDPERDTYRFGMTALMWAAHLNKREIAEEIVRHGGDISRKSPDKNWTALDYAIDNNKAFLAKALRAVDAEVKEDAERRRIAEEARKAEEKRLQEQAALDMICNAGIPVLRAVPVMHPLKFRKSQKPR